MLSKLSEFVREGNCKLFSASLAFITYYLIILLVTSQVVGEKAKKLSYKDDISILICCTGHHISLNPEYLSQEREKIQREELPYFRNLVQAAEGVLAHLSGTAHLLCFTVALGDDPELEPSWTAISQNNLAWFDADYIPTFLDAHGKEGQVHIWDPTKMSVLEQWACIEHWYSLGKLQMRAWKPQNIPNCFSPLPFEHCWWHPAFPGWRHPCCRRLPAFRPGDGRNRADGGGRRSLRAAFDHPHGRPD